MQSINTVDLQKLMRTRSISKFHFQYRYVVFFEIRDYYATNARLSLSLSLSLTCFSKFADSLDPKDLRLLAKPNQGQTGIPRINLVSERPTLRPMPRKNWLRADAYDTLGTFISQRKAKIQTSTYHKSSFSCMQCAVSCSSSLKLFFLFFMQTHEKETQLCNYV